jgi:hypothetical protein
MIKTFISTFLLIMMTTKTTAQIPAHWAQITLSDTLELPAAEFFPIFFQFKLEDIARVRPYKGMPAIVSTSPVQGDFATGQPGASRRVHFDNGKNVLETILEMQVGTFLYELTEVEIAMKAVAHRARGRFVCTALLDGRSQLVWTYGFEQKNFLAKWAIQRYVHRTHQHWMRDTLGAIKRLSEKQYLAAH